MNIQDFSGKTEYEDQLEAEIAELKRQIAAAKAVYEKRFAAAYEMMVGKIWAREAWKHQERQLAELRKELSDYKLALAGALQAQEQSE